MLSATWGRWEVEGRGVPELPWVTLVWRGLVADEFFRGSRSLLTLQHRQKTPCDNAKKTPCNNAKEGGVFAQRSTNDTRDTEGSPPHNCMCATRRTELPDKPENKIRGFASTLDRRK